MSETRLYAPALVLFAWALAWQAGVRGPAVIGLWLFATTVAVGVHIHETIRRHR